jgi:hypothetical protein
MLCISIACRSNAPATAFCHQSQSSLKGFLTVAANAAASIGTRL